MARIKINDLQDDCTITKKELKQITGGFNPQPEPPGHQWQPRGQWAPSSRFGLGATMIIDDNTSKL